MIGAVLILLSSLVLSRLSIDYTQLASVGYLGVLVATFLGSAAGFLPAPNMLIVLMAGKVWDPLGVGIAGGLGSALGEVPSYVAGRFGATLIEDRSYYRYIQVWMESKYSLLIIFLLAALPNPVYDLVGLASGAMQLRLVKFFFPCLLGKLLRFTIIAYLSSRLALP